MDMSSEIKKLKSVVEMKDKEILKKETEISQVLKEIDQLQLAKKKLTEQFQSQNNTRARLSHQEANDLHELNQKLVQEIKVL